MAALQIDSVNVFSRSHYMPLYSRLGAYDRTQLDELLFEKRAPYVEYWAHMAAFIAIDDWALFDFRMRDMRSRYRDGPDAWLSGKPDVVEWVYRELSARGPLRPAEIEYDVARSRQSSWWGWSDVKRALELLWLCGDVAIAGRRGFERRYALVEHVIPRSVLDAPVPRAEALLRLVERATRALGVATAADIADYWRVRDRRAITASLDALVDIGSITPVTVEGWQSRDKPTAAWMDAGASVPRRIDTAALLTPFDPMVWFRDRASRLFGFDYRIEIYTPAHKRRYGYYSLPVLVDDRIVARIDLKADRQRSTLLVQSAWWEGEPQPNWIERVAQVLLDAASWQRLESVSISRWGDATDSVAGALPRALRHG
nr:crosslink repair DNA glycosylase YcaQ family protein [Microbacterium endophyticum]